MVWDTEVPVRAMVVPVDTVVAGTDVDGWAVMEEVGERWEVEVLPVENVLWDCVVAVVV